MTNFYENKRVLVLGGAGFLGSHLVPKLIEAGAVVVVADDRSRGINQCVECVSVQIDCAKDTSRLRELLGGTDIIFNLAAWVAGVIYNQKNHGKMFTRNLAVQAIPLQIAAKLGVERFVQVSSACIYSPDHNHPALEVNGHVGEPVQANIGYSLAKRMGERLAVWAHQETGLHTVIVRPSNLAGERDYFDDRAHVVPALIKKCYNQDPIKFFGTGEEIREFLYVGDCADGLMAAAERGRPGEAYNLGTHGATAISIRGLFNLVRKITRTEGKGVQVVESHDPGDLQRWSNCRKAYEELEWRHQTGLLEMLEKTVEWYGEQFR